eukprot:snap_masked-scaffold_28-processed-gene-2.28-mRNA-1 protein AED:1.00 eAED:1.00 QI:0/0/0/0/1/1/2/0/140
MLVTHLREKTQYLQIEYITKVQIASRSVEITVMYVPVVANTASLIVETTSTEIEIEPAADNTHTPAIEVSNLLQSTGPSLRTGALSALQVQGTQEVMSSDATSAAIRACLAKISESCTSGKFFSSKKLGSQPRAAVLGLV